MPGIHTGRKGRRWRRARAYCLSVSTVCHLCGHDGAGEADHHPLSVAQILAAGLDPDDPAHLRPAHGSRSRCATCGECCNQAKNARNYTPRTSSSRDW